MTIAQEDLDAEHLRLLSIFHYIVAALMAAWGSVPIIHVLIGGVVAFGKFSAPKSSEMPPAIIGWFFMLFGGAFIIAGWTLAGLTLFAGRSLAKRKRYLFCLILAGVMAATCMPFGTILGVFTIIVLVRPTVKEVFSAEGVP